MGQSQVLIKSNFILVRMERYVTVLNEGETYPGCTQVEQYMVDKESGGLLKYLERVKAPNGDRLKSYYVQVQYAPQETRISRLERFSYTDRGTRDYKLVTLDTTRRLQVFEGKHRHVIEYEDSRGNCWKPEWGIANPFRESVGNLFRSADYMRKRADEVIQKHLSRYEWGIANPLRGYIPEFKPLYPMRGGSIKRI